MSSAAASPSPSRRAGAAGGGAARTAGGRSDQARSRAAGAGARAQDPGRTGARASYRAVHLDRDAAERVLRRAVELVDDGDPAATGISVAALLEAADELGIDAADVLRAVAEERLGLLSGDRRLADRVVGPEAVVASRLVDGSSREVLGRADAWLRRDALRRTRDQAGWAEYRRRSDPVASLQRTARSVQGERQLERVHRVRVVVSDVGDGRCLVGLVVDAHAGRVATAAASGAAALTGVGAALVNLVAGAPGPTWLVVPAAGAAGAGVLVGRRAHVDRVEEELQALLDRIGSGAVPAGALDGLTTRVLRGRTPRPPGPPT